jgi:hypothetical protein
MGGVNHCSLHCRLAKFRGLMIVVKNGAVIGQDMRYCVCAQLQFPGYGCFKPITAPYLPTIIKRQCKLQWLTPPRSLQSQYELLRVQGTHLALKPVGMKHHASPPFSTTLNPNPVA